MSDENKILILGGSSYIGRNLSEMLNNSSCISTYCNHPEPNGRYFNVLNMDLSEITSHPEEFTHAVILLGDTRADFCATHPKESYELNVSSIKHLIDCLIEFRIKPIFASTEWVFDGVQGNYVETDKTNPILTYGRQKVEIERYLLDQESPSIIVRLSKVFGTKPSDGTLFSNWLKMIGQHETIHCAADQIFSPVHIRDVTRSIIGLIENNCSGIYHVSNSRAFTRLELLHMLLSRAESHLSASAKVVSCSINDFGLAERRQSDVSMNTNKLIKKIGIRLMSVMDAIDELLANAFEHNYTLGLEGNLGTAFIDRDANQSNKF